VAVIPAVLLLATVLLMRDAPSVRAASPDAAKARNRVECGAKNVIRKNVASIVKITPPAPSVIKVKGPFDMAFDGEFEIEGDIQWCWGQHCVHTAWYCPDPYDAVDLGPCTIACCLGGNCGPSVTCEDRAQ
jgi:hypothetical protein